MAVIEHFEAHVSVEGERCHEYTDDELDLTTSGTTPPSVARYIEVKSGQHFSLDVHLKTGYQFSPGSNAICWDFHIDGNRVDSWIMEQDRYSAKGYQKSTISGKQVIRAGQAFEYPFTVWDLDITQDSVKLDSKSMAKYGNMGTIELQIFPYWSFGEQTRPSHVAPNTVHESISEKALKGRAVTLHAGLADAKPCDRGCFLKGQIFGSEQLAKFTFHYRTKKGLKDLMVIPKDDIETMTAEELRPLLRQQRINETLQAKKEASQSQSETKPPLKSILKKPKRSRDSILIDDDNDDDDDDILEIRQARKVKVEAEVIEIDSD